MLVAQTPRFYSPSLKLLALDTSTAVCSVALLNQGKITYRYAVGAQHHARLALPMVQQLLSESNLSLNDLNALVLGRGPGSFTGLRLATAMIQGLAFGSGLPVIAVSSLQALAQGALRQGLGDKIFACLDARRQEIYWGLFSLNEAGVMESVTSEAVQQPDTLDFLQDQWIGVGNGCLEYKAALSAYPALQLPKNIPMFPDAYDMFPFAVQEWMQGRLLDAEQALPVYLRDKVV
jgi:tRNA threonylcarbamoyladenosine biosynthesis protein TsaB